MHEQQAITAKEREQAHAARAAAVAAAAVEAVEEGGAPRRRGRR